MAGTNWNRRERTWWILRGKLSEYLQILVKPLTLCSRHLPHFTQCDWLSAVLWNCHSSPTQSQFCPLGLDWAMWLPALGNHPFWKLPDIITGCILWAAGFRLSNWKKLKLLGFLLLGYYALIYSCGLITSEDPDSSFLTTLVRACCSVLEQGPAGVEAVFYIHV